MRPVSSEDRDLLVSWHRDPEVFRWWGGGSKTPDEVASKYLGARSPDVECFIVESDGRDVGFIQYWTGDAPGTGGLDMFLIPEARGRGLGPDAARAMVRFLQDELGWHRITVDPLVSNPAALAAWSKAGFVSESEHDGEEGRYVLMAIESAASRPNAG